MHDVLPRGFNYANRLSDVLVLSPKDSVFDVSSRDFLRFARRRAAEYDRPSRNRVGRYRQIDLFACEFANFAPARLIFLRRIDP